MNKPLKLIFTIITSILLIFTLFVSILFTININLKLAVKGCNYDLISRDNDGNYSIVINEFTSDTLYIPFNISSITLGKRTDKLLKSKNNLKVITVDKNNAYYFSENNYLLQSIDDSTNYNICILACNESKELLPTTKIIGKLAFAGCEKITSFNSLNVETIEDEAFYGCINLDNAILTKTVQIIRHGAFTNCKKLTIFTDYTNLPFGWKDGITEDIKVSYKNEGTIAKIGDFIYELKEDVLVNYLHVAKILKYVGTDSNVVIRNIVNYAGYSYTVNEISASIFDNFKDVEHLAIPNTITKIEDGAFDDCNNLIYNRFDQGYYLGDTRNPYNVFIKAVSNDISTITINKNTEIFYGTGLKDCKVLSKISMREVYGGYLAYIFGGKDCKFNEVYVPSTLKEVTITDCSEINSFAFYNCNNIAKIELPKNITKIGYKAFYGCNNLTTINLPNSIKQIGEGAFRYCSGLKSITIPSNLKTIEKEVFANCKNLTNIVIPKSVNSIEIGAFTGCEKLEKIILPFIGNGSDEAHFGYIFGASSYSNNRSYVPTNLKEVIITGGTSIGSSAFYNCSSLTSIEIPNSVTSIRNYAFYNCSSLTSIEIPNSVTSIGMAAFYECSSLTSIEIPNTVTSIGSGAFNSCSSLTSITIPTSVTSIEQSAFYNCSSLSSISLPFVGNGSERTHLGYIFGANSYYDNSSYVPTSLKEVIITGGTSIGRYAFYDCSSLTSIEIPNSVTSIGDYAFSGCTSLTSITLPFVGNGNGKSHFGYIFGANSYYDNSSYVSTSLKEVIITTGDTLDDYAFYNCNNVTHIELPNSLINIGSHAFEKCNLLETVMAVNVEVIGDYAFSDAINITRINTETDGEIKLGKNCVSIGDYAFKNLSMISKVEILSNNVSYGKAVFYGMNNIKTLYMSSKSSKSEMFTISNSSSYPWRLSGDKYISGNKGVNNSTSTITFTFTQALTINISYSVSSEASYDKFYLKHNSTTVIDGISGNSTGTRTILVSPSDKLVFSYSKDGSSASGNDQAQFSYTITDVGYSYLGNYFEEDSTNSIVPTTLEDVTITNCENLSSSFLSGISSIKNISLPDTITIENEAFADCVNLHTISISNEFTKIGDSVFSNCSNLTNVYYKGTIEDWCKIPFNNEYSNPMYYASHIYMLNENNEYQEVTEIVIPETIIEIGNYQFSGFKNVTNILISSSVTSICVGAFSGTDNLTCIKVDSGNKVYDSRDNCNAIIETATNTLVIGFMNTIIPSTITRIGEYAFSYCNNLISIEIPTSVTSIGQSAFSGCSSLTSIEIPDSVISIGSSAFSGCSSLTSITLPFVGNGSDQTHFGYIFGNVPTSLKEVIITGGTSIGYGAFYGCSSLTNITIPNSVTSIGGAAFEYCTSLTSIEIPNSVTSIGGAAFEYCTSLTSIEIPSSVTSIEGSAFKDCSSLTNVVISNSVTSIGNSAFEGCSSLTNIEIPNSVTSIGSSTFEGCSSLTSITMPFVGNGSNQTHFGYIFGASSYSDNSKYVQTSLKEVIITSVTSIGSSAFYGCSSLTSIEIPNSVRSIEWYAFGGCSSLTSMTLPFVGNGSDKAHFGYIFGASSCSDNSTYVPISLKEVIITGGTSIGNYAFEGCSSLTSIEIPNSVTSIGEDAFRNCSSLTSIEIPNSVTSIGYGTFYNCNSLTSITIPDSVTSIGSYAFDDCSSLTSIEIPDSVTSIGRYAFYRCSNLTIYCEANSKPDGWASNWNSSNCPVVWGYKK